MSLSAHERITQLIWFPPHPHPDLPLEGEGVYDRFQLNHTISHEGLDLLG